MVSLIRISLLLVVLCLSTTSLRADSVIVSKDVQRQAFSRDFLLAVFSMRVTRWPDGSPIRVFVFPDRHPQHHLFVKRQLKIFPYQLRNIWDRQVFTGTGESPRTVSDAAEMYQQVSQTPGAIGYLNTDSELNMEQVRIVNEY